MFLHPLALSMCDTGSPSAGGKKNIELSIHYRNNAIVYIVYFTNQCEMSYVLSSL